MRKIVVLFPVLCLLLLFTVPAFAQTVPAPDQVISPQVAVVMILSLIAGFVAHSVQSGSFLGVTTVPKPWIPWLTVLGTFLAGIGAYMTSPGFTLTTTNLLYAIVSGLSALTLGSATGIVSHALVVTPAHRLALRSATGGDGAGPAVVAAVTPIASAKPTAPTSKRLMTFAGAALVVIGVLFATQPRTDNARPAASEGAALVEGCDWFQQNKPMLITYTEADAFCVLTQLFTGAAVNPAAIVLACAPVTLEQVVAIIGSILQFYLGPTLDAGVVDAAPPPPPSAGAASGMYCGLGSPPIRGLPQCVGREVLLRITAVHIGAKRQAAR